MNCCEVLCTSRMIVPNLRATLGSWSGPKTRSATAPRIAISGAESIFSAGFFRPHDEPYPSPTADENYLHAREPNRDIGLDCHATQDTQSVHRSSRLLRSLEPQQARSRVLFCEEHVRRRDDRDRESRLPHDHNL